MSTKARLALELTLAGASGVIGGLRTITGGVGTFMGGVAGANQQLFYLLGNLRSIATAGAQFANALVAPNIQTENWTEQLTFLLGSAEAARDKLKELFSTANDSGLKVQDIMDLYFNLQRVSQGALTGDEDLALWIRSAKLTGQSAVQLGDQMSKLWTVLGSGEAPDRELKKLREDGLISIDAFLSLSELAEGGASAQNVFEAVREEMRRTTSAVDSFGPTFSDMQTRLSNFYTEAKRQIGTGLFDEFKGDLSDVDRIVQEFFDSGRAEKWAAGISTQLQGAFKRMKEASFGGVTLDDLVASMDNGTTATLLGEVFGVAADNFWRVMLYNAQRYGPDIARALIPAKLHEFLELDRQADMARIATGNITGDDLTKYEREIGRTWVDQQGGALADFGNFFKRIGKSAGLPVGEELGVPYSQIDEASKRQLLREYALSQGGPRLDLETVDPGRLLALRDPEMMRQIAEMQMQFQSGSSGVLNFSGANVTDRYGNSAFVEQSHLAPYLREVAQRMTESARTLELATNEMLRKLEASRTATF